ncbi:uncharacterized protein LOC110689038 [Chenopodium quinoa]|uniref:uncharacterized protein LOC110689038 n=1 Tax=Chenopodium quinoa TaxID=63459 RepID=UPI000B773B1F|nr:uncharacterized protein LOC110689038 [Chenopodium quinoa]
MILDRDKVQYSNWVELFECHANAYNVLDHIDLKTSRPTGLSDDIWKRLDSIVINWIYGTISRDLLETILCKGATAQEIWDKLKAIFQDNKTTRACRELKNLKDQLASVDQAVSEQNMVIRLVSGLIGTDLDTVAAIIQQSDPLPSFETARSRLLLEESRRANDNSASASSFVAQSSNSSSASTTTVPPQQQQQPGGRGGGIGGRDRGRGCERGKGRDRGQPQQQQQPPPQQQGAPMWGVLRNSSGKGQQVSMPCNGATLPIRTHNSGQPRNPPSHSSCSILSSSKPTSHAPCRSNNNIKVEIHSTVLQ